MITIAIPTGLLSEGSLELFSRAGVVQISREELGRRLLLERDGVRLVLVRPGDVAAYVDHGAADLGVVGKDSLWESAGQHYELLDLGFGGCSLVLAAPEAAPLDGPDTWPASMRVATKYPMATAAYMSRVGQTVEIVRLQGSVELAPLVGLTDAIADLTATGRTLRENHLRILTEMGYSTARLVANQASLKTRTAQIQDLVLRLRDAVAPSAPIAGRTADGA
ncbi:MAG TPA: ATP phosphoribosyltransferase [Candidatus Dormibacteraeota bacterium]|jgi:ATP phosphoribosyltransferase|nr:ATP phosphoribosyltransferase [Candidatus Dormibacteraeota bacterium]